jgi:hypothetical protein
MIWRAGRDDECYDIPVRLRQFAARPSIFPYLLLMELGSWYVALLGGDLGDDHGWYPYRP